MNKRVVSLFEIFLIVLSGVAFAHIMSEINFSTEYESGNLESKFISFIREKTMNYLARGLVSAQTPSVQTCVLDNLGSYCQEYSSEVCDSKCTSSCIPTRRNEVAECKIGFCFDPNLGLCNSGTPRATCENQGGTWSLESPVQCSRACCLIGPDGSGGANQAKLTTSRECNYIGQTQGAKVEWDHQTTGELQCLSKVKTQREGACVLELVEELNKYNCQFTTESKCLTRGGNFYVNQLCTNPSLNTKCEITSNTKCFEDKDGVYFIDSCENRANIYDSNRRNEQAYWNSVVPVGQSCSLYSGNNNLVNQQRCGNCDYLKGSICGKPNPYLDKQPILGQYVCKDLSCTDVDGKKRKHGESWCAFDSWTGLDGANGTSEERAVDVVGSRHYKKLCYEGEIRTEPCAEYRNGLCVEENVNQDFTTAQCRTNTGVLCTSYNEDKEKLAKCEETPDCFLKHVEVDKFKFDVCVPKYPPGLELSNEPQGDSEAICGVATQTCTYYEKKRLDGRWSCEINCQCKDALFAETMNNFCTSLGDCGSSFNLAGKLGNGYSISGDKFSKISNNYIEGLKKYIIPRPGQRVDGMTNEQIENALGFDPSEFTPDELTGQIAQFGLGIAGLIAWQQGAFTAGYTFASGGGLTTLNGLAGAANGAMVGAGIGYIIGLAFGWEGDNLIWAMVGGAVLFGIIYALVPLGPVGWVAAIVVAVVILITTLAGVGEYRERKVEFKCLPWQPPSGGADCDKCNSLGVGECTAYKCASLGKTCELINPNTIEESCININPNDASAPQISLNKTISSGLSYEEFANGIKIKNSSIADGCLTEYSPVVFDVLTNEPAQCKLSSTRPVNYKDMEDTYFDNSANRYVINHVESTALPTLDSLGVPGVESDPNRRGEYNLYVLCEDKSGNSVDNSYNIRFCVSPANDITPPSIRKFVPESPGVVSLSSTTLNLQFYTNEPATCRYSNIDQNYELMENEASCDNDLGQSTIEGWLCKAVLNITQNSDKYYFRCADKPWLGGEISQSSYTLESERNVNTESKEYNIQKTSTPLTISSVSPNNKTIISATTPVSVTLEVVTNGGIDSGKSSCKYSFNGNQYIDFSTTSLSNHKQIFTTLVDGDYDIKLRCNDRAGNIVEGNSKFKIEVDNSGPLITRVYNSGNNIVVITNENSVCEYSSNSCSFEFGNGTALSGATKNHRMSYSNSLTYNIKCKDIFGNVGSCLSISGGY